MKIILTIIAVLTFLFVVWKKLKEDYVEAQIFSTGFFVLLGFLFGKLLADSFSPGFWFWLSFFGGLIGAILGIIRFNLRVYETLEALVLGCLTILTILFLYDFFLRMDLFSGLSSIVTFGLIIFYQILDSHYKRFTWYKSGRVGFSGLTVVGVFFLIRVIVALSGIDVLSFVGKNDAILSGIFAFISFLSIFNLARQT